MIDNNNEDTSDHTIVSRNLSRIVIDNNSDDEWSRVVHLYRMQQYGSSNTCSRVVITQGGRSAASQARADTPHRTRGSLRVFISKI